MTSESVKKKHIDNITPPSTCHEPLGEKKKQRKMAANNEIKSRITRDNFDSELFLEKSNYILHNPDVDYEDCSLWDFFENIFWRPDNLDTTSEVYPFEDTLCKEYLDWRDQANEKGFKNIIYQPDQNFKYNALWLVLHYKGMKDGKPNLKGSPYVITNGAEQIEKALQTNHEAVISSPITYVGRNRTAKNARYLYALAFDLDGVGMNQVTDLLYQMSGDVLPTANIIVNSGNGLHLYYILKKPIALFKDAVEVLQKLKRALTTKIWNKFTSSIEKPQYQGIFQGFRVPESRTKRGEKVKAFINRECPLYSVEDLARRVSNGDDKSIIKEWEWKRLDSGTYSTDRQTLKKAKEKYPEWYERVIVKGDKTKRRWNVSRDLYDWWVRKMWEPTTDITVGHRYFCLLSLSMFAIKCNVSEEELKKDLYSLVPHFDKLSKTDDNRFTETDAEDALKAYKDDFCTFPRNSIEFLTGVRIPKNKRNYQNQKDHLEVARAIRDIRVKQRGENRWDENNGRPSGSVVPAEDSPQYIKVQEWRKKHPKNENKSLCARETGLSRPTVYKWWKSR